MLPQHDDPYLELDDNTLNTVLFSDYDIRTMKGVLSAAEVDLMALDAEIARLQAQRTKHITHIERLRSAIAPHKRLPPEIIALIFVYCVSGNTLSLPPSRPDMTTDPHWVLRHVCSKWREIALNELRLWDSVMIEIPGVDLDRQLEKISELCDQLLPSTGSLSITLLGTVNDDDGIAVNSILRPNIARLRALELFLSAFGFHEFFKLPPSSFISLEWLRVDCLTDLDLDLFDYTPPHEMFSRLHQLEISGALPQLLNLMEPRVPWHQLTDLDISHCPSPTTGFNILRRCTHLETCTIQIFTTGDTKFQPPGMITLPRVKSMSLLIPHSSFLDCLILPSLTDLQIGMHKSFPVQQIISLVNRSACVLRVLAQYHDCVDETYELEDLDKLLSLVPSLEELKLFHVKFREPTLRQIGSAKLLPRLKSLTCRPEPLGAFIDMLEDRLSSSTPSKQLREARGICPIDLKENLIDFAARMKVIEGIYGSHFMLVPCP